MADFQTEWVKPVQDAIDNLQKISIDTKYKLPDNTEVSEPFNYLTENSETKKVVADILTSPSTDIFMQKFMKEFGTDESGKMSFSKLAEALTFLKEKNGFIEQAMSVGASKGVSNHLKEEKTGNLTEKRTTPTDTVSSSKAITEAMNLAFVQQNK